MEPEEHLFATDRAQLRRWIPWLHLFRGFGIALDFRKLLICLCGLVVFLIGSNLAMQVTGGSDRAGTDAILKLPTPADYEARDLSGPVEWAAAVLLLPLRCVVEPGLWLLVDFRGSPGRGAKAVQLVWALLVWSFVGGAVVRLARSDVARGERGSLAGTVRFARRRYLSLLSVPLLPALALAGLILLTVLTGFAGRIPGMGPLLLGLLWYVALLLGVVQVAVMIGLFAGWPLMIATISFEGADAFEGFSRAFSYVFSRPWYLVWLVAVAAVYGVALLVVASAFCTLAGGLAAINVFAGLGAELPATWILQSPGGVLELLLAAFAVSYVWSQVAMIYSLLRLSVDHVPLDDLVEEPAMGATSDLPLVGVAASEAREQQLRQSANADSSEEPSASTV
ncbi:hypothetical protein Mal4_21520 [Maioricimonas rarisocia]|uniref:Glycerophosphoryl diester phosphodiesterase membrane domain-containing protein n=1 Tax=Maioricimonas rarisocia TaxID=2528026 RepID=A0A517Z5U8_9PLAN|nr:hypothetical protein [Maioricimonas rarisocia]QDU37835.1 hypothetical protein Mal4_21520 [Maioricimonas rarisocia]